MDFINVLDDKGKEVYEEDICQWDCEDGKAIGVVRFKEFDDQETPLLSGYYLDIIKILENDCDDAIPFLVIGNTYQNQDLL